MAKQPAEIIWYDEISGISAVQTTHANDTEKELELTRDNEQELISELYAETPEDAEMLESDEGPDWKVVSIARTPRATLVEWKSSRGHFSSSLIRWP